MEFGAHLSLAAPVLFQPWGIRGASREGKGLKRYSESINVRNGTWWPGFARAASRPT